MTDTALDDFISADYRLQYRDGKWTATYSIFSTFTGTDADGSYERKTLKEAGELVRVWLDDFVSKVNSE